MFHQQLFILGKGSAANQLNKPTDLSFDMIGNLYVCDMDNNRIQKFALIDNQPCSSESTGSFQSRLF